MNRAVCTFANVSKQCSTRHRLLTKQNNTVYFLLRHICMTNCRIKTGLSANCITPLFGGVSFHTQSQRCDVQKQKNTDNKDLVESKYNPYAGLSTGEKVKEAGKDASYAVVIVVGLGVTGIMFYMIGRELFSSQSPGGIYSDAFKKCKKNDQLVSMLGEPVKGYGETTRRGRRRHVSHEVYQMGGVEHLRMKFYVEGPHAKATVNLEMNKKNSDKYEYRYIVAELNGYPKRSVLVLDNT